MKLLHHSNDYRQRQDTSTYVANNGGRTNSISARRLVTSNSLLSFKVIGGLAFLTLLALAAVSHLNNTAGAIPTNTSDSQIPATALPSSNDVAGTTDINPTATDEQDNSSEPSQSSSNRDSSVDVSISSNSDKPGVNSAQVSVNGQPVAVPANGSTEHTSVISSPNQTTSFTVSSDKNNNGSSSGFSSSSENLFVDSSTVSHNQEGE